MSSPLVCRLERSTCIDAARLPLLASKPHIISLRATLTARQGYQFRYLSEQPQLADRRVLALPKLNRGRDCAHQQEGEFWANHIPAVANTVLAYNGSNPVFAHLRSITRVPACRSARQKG